jgi:hypothetical protein
MRLAEAYRSLARPSSALEPSHPLAGISSLCPTKLSERLVAKLVHGVNGPIPCGDGPQPFHIESASMCALVSMDLLGFGPRASALQRRRSTS